MCEWPPRFTLTPEGCANLFLMSFKNSAGKEERDKLVAIFREFYELGYRDGKASEGE